MGTILWKNLNAIPAEQRDAECGDYDELGHLVAGHEPTEVIYVYFGRGGIVEVRPATAVRLSGDCLSILNGKEVVARYPRERVVQATRQLIEPTPFE